MTGPVVRGVLDTSVVIDLERLDPRSFPVYTRNATDFAGIEGLEVHEASCKHSE